MVIPGRGYWGIHKQVPILKFDHSHTDGCSYIDTCQ